MRPGCRSFNRSVLRSVQTLDDADVALAGIAERFQRLSIGRAVMSRHRLRDIVEPRDRGALGDRDDQAARRGSFQLGRAK